MHDTSKHIGMARQAFWSKAPLEDTPRGAFLLNRLDPLALAVWDAARAEDWALFVECLREVYHAGLVDGGVPLAALLAVTDDDEDGEV